ncbi:COG1361 S-layer family protein [Methanimicrococcus blatticola]|uniref:S-layer protein n=1 Tax=Methanimicrococcus blatticola TaxID=91560 RepID=A0A484F3L5_9EURY|nr:hypothetical protein [Methanimicrococcus blatticola]MBZ3935693.1 hypothetical protein [Methanimicrococcus blatticola]MCC2508186.1 hypothetical protein [Methanimicrococcus blatticola]TDQ68738.1 hypothetical protein C7391_0931 [Methanimicrococcus blatticola]
MSIKNGIQDGIQNEIQNHPANKDQLRGYGIMNTQKENQLGQSKKQSFKYGCLIAAVLVLLSLCSPAVADSFSPVMTSDTLDYYTGYGEPNLTASLRGNNEFGKGESATVQISIANKGELEKLVYKEYIVPANLSSEVMKKYLSLNDSDPGNVFAETEDVAVIKLEDYLTYSQEYSNMTTQNALATAEMQIEAGRTTANYLNVKFVCDSPYIEVETGGDYTYIQAIPSGSYNVAKVPIRISPDTPAGEYVVNMTIDYQYPSNAKMIRSGVSENGGFTTFMYSDSYVQEYEPRKVVLQIPIYVKSGAVFETSEINGTLSAGKTRTVSVTYTNIGDETAYDAEAKLSLMHPLSSARNKALLGDVAPGESVVIEYPISAHATAIEKAYGVNTDIRYYDEDDKLQIAPSVKLDIKMVNPFTIFTFKNALVGVLILVAASLVYDYTKKNKKKNGKEDESETGLIDSETDSTESED